MNNRFICLTDMDGNKIRIRVDTILEYGELYAEDQMVNDTQVVVGDKRLAGSYINSSYQDGESTWVKETVDQIDEVLSLLGFEYEYVNEDLAEQSAEGITDHLNAFDKAWSEYGASQPKDPAKWQKPFDETVEKIDRLVVDNLTKTAMPGLQKIVDAMKELDWSDEGMNLFLHQDRECWAGMTPIQMVLVGRGDAVVEFLKRLKDGDPVA